MILQEPLPLSPSLKNPVYILNQHRSIRPETLSFCETTSGSFRSQDPRTFNSPHAMYLQLDRPPDESYGTQPQQNVNCIGNENKTGYYPSYESIYGGNISYYTDITNDEPFGGPVFQNPSQIYPTLLIDPMGSRKPYYQRVPMFKKQSALYDYSFDQDQCEFREDLIALQQSKTNQSDFKYHLFSDPNQYYPKLKSNYRPVYPIS